jgi:DNA-binding response OmpR family regulator
MIAMLIIKMGHQPLQVFDYLEAADILFYQKIKPKLILCDVNLPIKSGFELVKQVIVKNIDLSICMLSGQNERENRLEALQLGAVDFVSKPIDPKIFIEKINKILLKTIVQNSLPIKLDEQLKSLTVKS